MFWRDEEVGARVVPSAAEKPECCTASEGGYIDLTEITSTYLYFFFAGLETSSSWAHLPLNCSAAKSSDGQEWISDLYNDLPNLRIRLHESMGVGDLRKRKDLCD